jgi:5'-3' exonuclease
MLNKKTLSRYSELAKTIEKSPDVDSSKPRILFCDGTNTFMRSIAANNMIGENGMHIGGVSGFLLSLGFAIKTVRPNKVIIVFDGKGGSLRRKKLFPEYKAQRNERKRIISSLFKSKKEEQEAICFEINRLTLYLKSLPVNIVVAENIEADDAIAYFCTDVFKNDDKIIMSSDKDFLQLVNENTKVWSPTKKILYDEEKIKEEFLFLSQNFIIFKVLTGDISDNISGIKGLGLKTLQKHIPFLFESRKVELQEVINFSEKYSTLSKTIKKIFEQKEKLYLNYKLMQLSDVNISDHTKIILTNDIKRPANRLNKFNLSKLFLEDSMNSQIKDLNGWIRDIWWALEMHNLKQ